MAVLVFISGGVLDKSRGCGWWWVDPNGFRQSRGAGDSFCILMASAKTDMQAKEILSPTYSIESETTLKAQITEDGGKFDFQLEKLPEDKK